MSGAWKVKVSCAKVAVLGAGFPIEFSKTELSLVHFLVLFKANTEASLKRDLLKSAYNDGDRQREQAIGLGSVQRIRIVFDRLHENPQTTKIR